MKKFSSVVCLLAIGVGCAGNPAAFYSIHQVDLGPKSVYVQPENLEVTKSSIFEDEFIKVAFKSSVPGIGIAITNKSDGSIYVNWDGAAYIDTDGKSHRVIHSGIKYIQKEETQAETVIPRGSSIDDAIHSVDSIFYLPDYGWIDAMITIKMWGDRIKVLLPVRCGESLREYLFDLEIMNEDVVLGLTEVKNGAAKS